MSGIDQILSIGEAALRASQLGMQVVSHNVANVNTPGYSRQELILETNPPLDGEPGQIGTGVQAVSIQRIYDQFLGVQIQQESSKSGSLEVKSRAFLELEGLLNGLEDQNLLVQLDRFWSAWEELSLNPQGQVEKELILTAAGQLASYIRSMASGIDDLMGQMDETISFYVDRINELSGLIADVNREIQFAEASGQNPNDLKDKRDAMMEELASLLDIHGVEGEDGTFMVFGPGGRPLVMGQDYWRFEVEEAADHRSRILWMDADGDGVDVTAQITTGSLGGALEMRDVELSSVADKLDRWAGELMWQVNSRHGLSIDADNMPASVDGSTSVPAGTPLNDPSLPFGSKVKEGSIYIWLYDGSVPPQPTGGGPVEIEVDPSWTLEDLADAIQTESGGSLSATINPDRTLSISVNDIGGGETYFAVARDDSNVLASLGIGSNVPIFEGRGALDIQVGETVSSDPSRIGAAGVSLEDGSLPSPGENEIALSIAALREEVIEADGFTGSLAYGFSEMVSEVGMKKASTDDMKEYQQVIVAQLKDERSSISGVNLDEEMIKMMKYQWGYQAAAKIIKAGQEMLDTILEMV